MSNVTITPSSGVYTGTGLSCSAGATDPDDGTLVPSYVWSVNGITIGTGASYTVSANDTNVGNQVVCTASATDSNGQSASATDSVTVSNTGPVVSNVSISPSSNVTNDMTLSCTASAMDADEAVTAVFNWSVNGGAVGSGSSIDLSTLSVSPTDTVGCRYGDRF